ncbi:MAG: hypothetical protein HKN61_02845 [Flavobacteriaceae bacterium]|nr:hypothetical protein [Flavobacteriaceae bacterium]
MKSTITTFCISLGIALTISAQDGRYNPPTAYIQNTASGNINVPVNVLGSPYLDEEFKLGTVLVKDDDSYTAYMRYNAFHDEIEMQENNKAVSLIKRDYVAAKLNGMLYKIIAYDSENGIQKGYAAVLKEGATSFYLKQQVVLREAKEATSSYSKGQPPKFEREDFYLLGIGDAKPVEIKLNKKSVLDQLSTKRKAVEKYVKEYKLKLKSEAEVLQLLDYYENL